MKAEIKIRLIVGLGNPGLQYEKTRHNVGFWLVNSLAEKYKANFKLEPKFKGMLSNININGLKCILLMPMTFMNLSGESIHKVSTFYKIPIEEILVVHDELDFPPAIARLKKGGGANGHNGVQNTINQLGDNNFWRLRIGIGRPLFKEDIINYVTSSPNKSDAVQIHEIIDQSVAIIPNLILGNFEKAMQDLH